MDVREETCRSASAHAAANVKARQSAEEEPQRQERRGSTLHLVRFSMPDSGFVEVFEGYAEAAAFA